MDTIELLTAACVVLVFVLLCLRVKNSEDFERLISAPAYKLTSGGLNLHSRGGYYLGGLAVIDSAENANRTDQIKL